MNLRKVILPVMGVAALLLAGCAKEVSYDEFHAQAVEAAKKEVEYTKAEINMDLTRGGLALKGTATYDWATKKVTGDAVVALVAPEIMAVTAVLVPSDANTKYFLDGENFKVETTGDQAGKAEFEGHGLLTYMEYDNNDDGHGWVRVAWSK